MVEHRNRFAAAIVGLLATVVSTPLAAQPPSLNSPFPMGMRRGTSLDLVLTGKNLSQPTGLWTSFPARVEIPNVGNNGKDNSKLRVRLHVDKGVPIGWHTIRLSTVRGISNFRLFCIDDLPQILETQNNHSPSTAQRITAPCVICGRIDAERIDHYLLRVSAGQRLCFEVLGRRLGSPLDPHLSLVDPKTGTTLAMSDDAPGLDKDPRLIHVFEKGGDYLLKIKDVRFQGGSNWYYRLRIGDFPCATTPIPLAVQRGATAVVTFAGPEPEMLTPVRVRAPADPDRNVLWLWPASTPLFPDYPAGLPGWPVSMIVSDQPELAETEPNDDAGHANPMPVPGGVSGRILVKGDLDCFRFQCNKGQQYRIEAETFALHSPAAVYLTVTDPSGKQLAASNPAKDPPRIDFKAPADGPFIVTVEHLHYSGGPEETYRITVRPQQPGFQVRLSTDRLTVPEGGAALVVVSLARNKYGGPVAVRIEGDGDLHGRTLIPAGQNAGLLRVTAGPKCRPGPQVVRVVGEANIGQRPVRAVASFVSVVQKSLANLPYPPAHLGRDVGIGVEPPAPFALSARFAIPEGVRGLPVPVKVTVSRNDGFDGEIVVQSISVPAAKGKNPAGPTATVKIAKGKQEAVLTLKPDAKAPLVTVPIGFIARAKVNGREVATAAEVLPLKLTLPVDVKVDAGSARIHVPNRNRVRQPGVFDLVDLLRGQPLPVAFGMFDWSHLSQILGKHRVDVVIARKGGYQGPVVLEVRNLPAHVSAPKVTIPAGQDRAAIILTAAANASGTKQDVHVVATATKAGNQQSRSPNFTLTVVK